MLNALQQATQAIQNRVNQTVSDIKRPFETFTVPQSGRIDNLVSPVDQQPGQVYNQRPFWNKVKVAPTQQAPVQQPKPQNYWEKAGNALYKDFGSVDEMRAAAKMLQNVGVTGGQLQAKAVEPTPTPAPVRPALNSRTPQDIAPFIYSAAEKYGVNPVEFSNLLARESMGFNPNVMNGKLNSPVGAQGVAQFMPATSQWLAKSVYQDFDPLVPEQAIMAAAAYLDYIKRQYDYNDWRPVYASYNAGPGQIHGLMKQYGDYDTASKYFPRETQNYVPAVLGIQ